MRIALAAHKMKWNISNCGKVEKKQNCYHAEIVILALAIKNHGFF